MYRRERRVRESTGSGEMQKRKRRRKFGGQGVIDYRVLQYNYVYLVLPILLTGRVVLITLNEHRTHIEHHPH